jgi:hypothetical protein
MTLFQRFSVPRTLLTVAILVSLLAPALAVRPAQAAPSQDPASGGTITVNSNLSVNFPDTLITLREAILIANGGTGPTGLNRPLLPPEMAQLSGCTFSSGYITGGCGSGLPDTIVFTGLTPGASIYLTSELPPVDDSAATTIDGSAGNILPTIRRDPGANLGFAAGLIIQSDNNVVQGIGFEGDPCGDECALFDGVEVQGEFNHFSNVWVWKMRSAGIVVFSNNNTFDGVRLGIDSPNDTVCWLGTPAYKGNTQAGLVLEDNAAFNNVLNSWIGCNGDEGVWAKGHNNTIGPNNSIGTNSAGLGPLSNAGDGIYLTGNYNTVISNTVAFNSDNGILVLSDGNSIGGNVLRANSQSGLKLLGPAQDNLIGGPQPSMPYGGNKIASNGQYGVSLAALVALAPHDNKLAGNWIGTLNGIDALPNALDGVLVDGANNNVIGQANSPVNIIGGNSHNGVRLTNGAHDNQLINTYIGTNGFTALPNQWNGVRLEAGAHHNAIGASGPANVNYILANGQQGVDIDGNNTSNNSVLNSFIGYNTGHGVRLTNAAHHTTLGGSQPVMNSLYDNGLSGVSLEASVHDNYMGGNVIYDNTKSGVVFSGLGTTNNEVDQAQIYGNHLSGIVEQSGAANNWWTHLGSHDNTGDGIAKQNAMTIPAIVTANAANGQVTVQGTASPDPGATADYLVELYVASSDGEGQQFVGSGYTNGSGNWSITFNGTPGCYTAFQTWIPSLSNSRASSKFAATYCVLPGQAAYRVYVPIAVRP